MIEIVIIQGEPFPPQGSQGTSGAEMQQKPLLDLFYPPAGWRG